MASRTEPNYSESTRPVLVFFLWSCGSVVTVMVGAPEQPSAPEQRRADGPQFSFLGAVVYNETFKQSTLRARSERPFKESERIRPEESGSDGASLSRPVCSRTRSTV
ncbi:uncharacterized protein V6R79_006492 [Siganus canaliculatus]